MSGPLLGEVLPLAEDEQLAAWGAAVLDAVPIAEIGDIAGALYALVVKSGASRIDPSAYVSPLANIGEDVVIGPGVRVHEFSTVRSRSVLSAGAHVGYGCEISRSVVGAGTAFAHRATVCCSVIGRDCHFATSLNTVTCLLSNPDMLNPARPVAFALPGGGRTSTGEPKWGALVGHRVRAGLGVTLGPGAVVGSDCTLHAGVTVATAWIPPGTTLQPAAPVGHRFTEGNRS